MKKSLFLFVILVSFVLSPLTWAGSSDPVLEGKSATDINIDGGAIDNTPVGGSTPQTGAFTTVDTTGDVTVGSGGDPADAGAIRLKNADKVVWEASPAGTDIEGIAVDANEVVQIGAAGASGVTITPVLTLTSGRIAFPATAVPSADANTFDDYEQGTHEVSLTMSTSGTITLNASYKNLGYTKIGNAIICTGMLIISSVDAPVGTLRISIPFTVGNLVGRGGEGGVGIGTYSVDFVSGTYPFIKWIEGGTYVEVKTGADNAGWTDVAPAADDYYLLSFSYFI